MRNYMILWIMAWTMSFHTGFAQTATDKTTETTPPTLLSITATPNKWSGHFNADCGSGAKCKRMGNKSLKNEAWTAALAYAASGLDRKVSKRRKRKLLALLTQANYDNAKAAFLSKKTELEAKTVSYQEIQTTSDMYNLYWYYMRFAVMNQLIKAIENPTNIGLYEISPDALETVSRKLDDYKQRSAQEYYDAGHHYLNQGNTRKDKNDWKRSALYFLIADQYVKGFKDAMQQYEAARKLATSTVYISSHYAYSDGFGRVLKDDVKTALQKIRGFNALRFVEITDNKAADYHVKLVVNGLELVTRPKTSDKQEYSKDVEVDGKTVTKKAVVTIYSSGYNARAKVNMNVIEKPSSKNIYSTSTQQTYEFVNVWQKGSGDLSIVKSRHKRHLGQPGRAPERKTLYERAIAMCARQIAQNLYSQFLYKIGSSPDNNLK